MQTRNSCLWFESMIPQHIAACEDTGGMPVRADYLGARKHFPLAVYRAHGGGNVFFPHFHY